MQEVQVVRSSTKKGATSAKRSLDVALLEDPVSSGAGAGHGFGENDVKHESTATFRKKNMISSSSPMHRLTEAVSLLEHLDEAMHQMRVRQQLRQREAERRQAAAIQEASAVEQAATVAALEIEEQAEPYRDALTTPLTPNLLTGLGAVKVGRLRDNSIETVEQLASIDISDHMLCRRVTGRAPNSRGDRASRTVQGWRDSARSYLVAHNFPRATAVAAQNHQAAVAAAGDLVRPPNSPPPPPSSERTTII